jgi:hypothetical protein
MISYFTVDAINLRIAHHISKEYSPGEVLLSREQNPELSVATDDAICTQAGYIIFIR